MESGMQVPEEPVLFNKSPNRLVGPNDVGRIPQGSTKTDWEACREGSTPFPA